jgi:putative endopeptidase
MILSLGAVAFADADSQSPDYSTGTPWPDIDLEGVVTEDTPVELKENYALYVNKDAILDLEIPEGYPYGGTIMNLMMLQAEDVKNMFLGEAPASHDARLAYDLFWLMMDWDSRNALGVAPLKELTDALEAVSTIDELTAYFVETPVEKQLGTLWGSGSIQDLVDSNRYIIALADPGLLLEDSAEYRELTPYGAVKKEAYTNLAKKMLLKLGYTEEETVQKINNCFAVETMMADAIYTNEEQQRPDYLSRIYNVFSREDVEEAQGKLPVLTVLEQTMGYPAAEEYIVFNPEYFEKLNEFYTEENLPLIRDMLIVSGAIGKAGSLDRECYEWSVECDNAVSGATGILDDETAFSGEVADMLSWPVSQLYTETYLNQADKDRISSMVDEILDAYHGILAEADFLSEETRTCAIEKLEAIDKHILYPDSWEKYSYEKLDFASSEEGGSYWDAAPAIGKFLLDESIEDYSKPFDKEKWGATPHTVNCFYNPQTNSIYIMGAFARAASTTAK